MESGAHVTIGRARLWIGGSLLAMMAALPVVGQESLLPPGFDQPPARPAPAPAPGPAPRPTPAPAAPSPAPRPAAQAPTATRPAASPAAGPDGDVLPVEEGAAEDELPPPPPRYDLPPGSRRLLTRIGPLTPESGGLPASAFGSRGEYLTALMNGTQRQVVSRWASILLRRALLSGVDTPPTVNGADFAAARALLLLRQGESIGARMLVQSVDVDKASPRLRQAAMPVFIANADPAGLCPYVPAMAGQGDDRWDLAQGMCAALVGESGTANAVIERIQRRGRLPAIDIKLAEKIVGAGVNTRRSATVLWDDVEELTPWRFGLATATGVEIPEELWATATPAMRQWAVQAPMLGVEQRVVMARDAAAKGVVSSRGYVDLVSWAADSDGASGDIADKGRELRLAFAAVDMSVRLASIMGFAEADSYAGMVLTARAAARVAPTDLDDAEAFAMLSAMFAGGYDNNAMAWASNVRVGSQAWGLLAVGSPRPLIGVDAGAVNDFNGDDDSADGLRTRFLAAALIGLDRVNRADVQDLARDYALALGTETRWTRAIRMAADRGEQGTVALLVAVGMQGRDWRGIPPYHLYQITRALREVGLGAEARMIAAEAITRA